MLKAVIFDFDGVLHNTFDFHRAKIKEFTGKDISEDCYKDIHDGNFYENKDNLIRDTDWSKYIKYIHPEQSRLKIKDEIRDVLKELGKKYELFIISSGGVKNISGCLGNNGILNIFTEVLGFETNTSKIDSFRSILKKHRLSADECIFITDTLGDIKEAKSVGVKTIAVDFGFHSKERLKRGEPYRIISCFGELMAVIEDMSDVCVVPEIKD